jgi:hypothetical protein
MDFHSNAFGFWEQSFHHKKGRGHPYASGGFICAAVFPMPEVLSQT